MSANDRVQAAQKVKQANREKKDLPLRQVEALEHIEDRLEQLNNLLAKYLSKGRG